MRFTEHDHGSGGCTHRLGARVTQREQWTFDDHDTREGRSRRGRKLEGLCGRIDNDHFNFGGDRLSCQLRHHAANRREVVGDHDHGEASGGGHVRELYSFNTTLSD